jgi:hypothetical protein
MVAIFATVGIGNHFFKNAPQAPQIILVKTTSLAGRGNLPALNIVVSQDAQLKRMVDELAAVPATDVFTRHNDVDMMVAQILFRWAGADMAPKEQNGPYIDSRVVAFLRRIGSFPVTSTEGPEIDIKQAANLEQLWFKIFEHYRVPLLAQTAAAPVFSGGVNYNPNADTLRVAGMVSPEFIRVFEEQLQISRNSGETMRVFLDFIDAAKGFNSLSEQEQDLIMSIDPPKTQATAEPTEPAEAAIP